MECPCSWSAGELEEVLAPPRLDPSTMRKDPRIPADRALPRRQPRRDPPAPVTTSTSTAGGFIEAAKLGSGDVLREKSALEKSARGGFGSRPMVVASELVSSPSEAAFRAG